MDKMTFASYKFKPSDVIEGLNRYFAETKANRYRRVPLEIRRGVCYNNPDCVRDIVFTNSHPERAVEIANRKRGIWSFYLICDPEEVVGVAINWLREEYDIFYTPGMEAPVEDFDADEAAKEYEKETRKNRVEELQESRRDLIEALQRRLYEAKRRIVGLEEGHAEKTKIIDRQKTMINDLEKQLREKAEENSVLRGNVDYFADLAQGRLTELSNLRYEILKIYREIFDCSNGDPEGSDAETLQDILTEEYKRVLELKNVTLEDTAEDLLEELHANHISMLNDYADLASELGIGSGDAESIKDYIVSLKKERERYKELARENEECLEREKEKVERLNTWTERMEQKLIEIQDICER